MTLSVGDPAPAFSVRDAMGSDVSLADFRGRTLVLAFYVLAFTGG